MGWRQIAILLAMVQVATAQAQEAKLPDFPRKNVARTYHVDPSWPKRPDGLNWDHVPGMFVDKFAQRDSHLLLDIAGLIYMSRNTE